MGEPQIEWFGRPVRLRLVQPTYQVVVDSVGVGEVWQVTGDLWMWRYFDTKETGQATSRSRAVRKVLAAHTKGVDQFANPSREAKEVSRG